MKMSAIRLFSDVIVNLNMRSTLTIFSWLHCLLGVAYCIERPQIMELNGFIMDEARIQKVDNDILVLSCFAYYPVKWVLPDNSQYQNYSNPDLDGRLKTVSSNADRYNITIVISDLRWTDTGFYRCLAMHSTDTKLNTLMGETENRIYLYVKDSDPKHLFLHLNGDMISFKRFETSYLNCLVTDISATVEISFETKIDDKLKYVNGFGFEVPPKALKHITNFDNAVCKANVNDNISSKVDSLSFIIVQCTPLYYNVNGIVSNLHWFCGKEYYSKRQKKGQITFIEGNLVNTSIKQNIKVKRFYANFKILMPQGYSSSDITVRWFRSYSTIIQGDVKEEEIRDSDTFSILTIPVINRPFTENADVEIVIIFRNVAANLSGDYTLSITAIDAVVNITFNVTVNSEPMLKLLVTETGSKVELNSNYLEKNRTYYVWCIAEGLPKQNPIILFRPCIIGDYVCYKKEWVKVTNDTFDKTATFQKALVTKVSAPKSGMYRCILDSEISKKYATIPFIITDIHDAQKNHGFNIEVIVQPQMSNVYQHSNVSLVCKMQIYDGYAIARWYYQSLNDRDYSALLQCKNKAKYYTIHNLHDKFSNKLILTINNIQTDHSGIYICRSCNKLNGIVSSNASIVVSEVVFPWMGNNSSQPIEDFMYSENASIFCDVHGVPFPKVQWLKDDEDLMKSANHRISFENDNTLLKISTVIETDLGSYKCIANNFAGQKMEKLFKRNVKKRPDNGKIGLISWSGLLGFFVLILLVVVVLQRRKHAKKLKKLQNVRQKLLEPCDKYIDKDRPIKEQPGSLSYPLQFEIPVQFVLPIHRPKILLGSGEFGEVVRSFLHIPADNLAVAVKIIKSTLPVDQIIELLSEVKIMIYSGYHINVLPLIGAVTSCLGMNKLYVVTELCEFGSLLDFVKNRRDNFINELITLNNRLRADNEHFFIPNGYFMPVLPRSLPDYHRSHSKGKADSKDLCTSDLLYFSYQIANGMEYLSNKKIIHRDLALRNILVTENNLIRISDFGLSRQGSMYQLEKNKFKLPYQWMAYESLTDYSFSEKSDIWSFGIVLWEIFTLGEQPYHEYKNFNDLKNALRAGKRLHKPVYASDKMYNFMKRCWSLKSELRPTFTECKVILAEELNTFCVECHSKIEIILNDPKNQPDYSALRAKFVENLLQSNNGYENMRNQSVENIKNCYYEFPNTSDTENGQPLIRNETKV